MTIEKRCRYLHYWNICGETFSETFQDEKSLPELLDYLIENIVAVDVDTDQGNGNLLFYKRSDSVLGRRGSGNLDFWFELPNIYDIVLDTRLEEKYCPEDQISPKQILALYKANME